MGDSVVLCMNCEAWQIDFNEFLEDDDAWAALNYQIRTHAMECPGRQAFRRVRVPE